MNEKKLKELEKEFSICWKEMLLKRYMCRCEGHRGFSINLKYLHIMGKKFKKDLFKAFEDVMKEKEK